MAVSPAKALPRLMFAKKPQPSPTLAAPKAGLGARLNPIANPYLGAGGASLLFLASAVALIMVLGDPQAGAPKLKVPLDAPSAGKGSLGLRSFTSPTSPLEGGALDNLAPGQDVGLSGYPEAGSVDAGRSPAKPSSPCPRAAAWAPRSRCSGRAPNPCRRRRSPACRPRSRRPAADHRRRRAHAVPGLCPAVQGRQQAARGHGGRRPGAERRLDQGGDRDPAARDHPVLRALCRRAAGLDRPSARLGPRGDARDPHGAPRLSQQRPRPADPDGLGRAAETRPASWNG